MKKLSRWMNPVEPSTSLFMIKKMVSLVDISEAWLTFDSYRIHCGPGGKRILDGLKR